MSTRFLVGSLAALTLALVPAAPAWAASGPLPRLAVSLSASPADAAVLVALSRADLHDRLVVAPPIDLGEPGGGLAFDALLASLPQGLDLLLHVRVPGRNRSATPADDEAAISSAADRAAALLPLSHERVRGMILEVQSPLGDPGLLQFAVAALAIRGKAAKPGLEVIVALPRGAPSELDAGAAQRIAAYSDGVAVEGGDGWEARAAAAWARLQRPIVLGLAPVGGLTAAYLDVLLYSGDPGVDTLWVRDPAPEDLSALVRTVAFVARSIPSSFIPASHEESPVKTDAEGEGPAMRLRRFVSAQSSDVAILADVGGTAEAARSLLISHAAEGFEVACYDASDGRRLAVAAVAAEGRGTVARCGADAKYVVVVLHRAQADDRVFESVSVAARADLRVEEVVARWQQYRQGQRQALRNYIANCLMSLHFEPAGLGSGFDVSVQLRELTSGGVREWVQDEFYVNGVRFGGKKGFPLPQLEPEKVVTQPLELSLDERYRYALDGIDTVDGTFCYVLRVEPIRQGETLYNGRIWIDGVTFRQVRMQLRQSGGRTNVVSHVETQDFQLVPAGAQQFNVFRSIDVQQVLNVAGRSLLLEKRYRFSNYRINVEDFEALATSARASNSPMFRDTAEGLRALKKEGNERTVETLNASRKMRSLLTGVFFDGNYTVPIPMAGVSMVDFDYRRTGAQLSVFFAGPFAAINLSKQRTSKLRLGIDLALSALPTNNRVYRDDRDVTSEGVWSFEETIGALASWQPVPSWSLSASSHASLNFFRGTSDKAPGFEVPGSGGTVYLTGESKITKNGYALTTTVMSGNRLGWSRSTGIGGQERLFSRHLKYYLEAGKQFYIGSFTKAALTGAYYGGRDLDRFSRYQPSFLSRPRIRGIPGGADTFDAVGVVGASYGFNVMEMVKLEGSYNHAWGRNTTESNRFRNYDGVEFDIGTAAPWGTFVQGTVSYALRGNLARYDRRLAVYLLVFKPL